MMNNKHTTVSISKLPNCDICDKPAYADASLGGPWAYVCKQHFDENDCKLGLGLGQKLILVTKGSV